MPINVVEYVIRRGGTAVHGSAYTEMIKTDDIQTALEKVVCVIALDKVEIKAVHSMHNAIILTSES